MRYKEIKGYKFDKVVFNAGLFLIFGWLLFVAWSYNFDLDYYSCGAAPGEVCKNPFYKSITWKNYEFLDPGEYGTKPNWLFWSCYWAGFGGLILMFISNHIIHNRHLTKPILKSMERSLNEDKDNS